jgi:hypothetical protein
MTDEDVKGRRKKGKKLEGRRRKAEENERKEV